MEAINGIEMYYELHGVGEPVVFLHGFGGSGADWIYVPGEWPVDFQRILVDLRGHGRSTNPSGQFTHRQAALDVLALLDRLQIRDFKGVGVSGGGNTLLHMATRQPDRVKAMVIVSATSYFPEQARVAMRKFSFAGLPEREQQAMRQRHKHGEAQLQAIVDCVHSMADSYEDMNFTPPLLSTIKARTLIVQGDRDFLYPIEISVEMKKAIPNSSLWIMPNANHGPIFGDPSGIFVKTATEFLRGE